MIYEVIFEDEDGNDIVEYVEFDDWFDLHEYIRRLRYYGCTNINATLLNQ